MANQNEQTTIRLNEKIKEQAKEKADKLGISLPAYIRLLIVNDLNK